MQKVKVTFEVELGELMRQVAEAVNVGKGAEAALVPLTASEKAADHGYLVKQVTKKHRKVYVSRAKPVTHQKLRDAIVTILEERGGAMFPREIKEVLLSDSRFKGLQVNQGSKNLIPYTMYFFGSESNRTKTPLFQRVADGYVLADKVESRIAA